MEPLPKFIVLLNIKANIVVASDSNLYRMRLLSEPFVNRFNFFLSPYVSHVSTVKKHISSRQVLRHSHFLIMRVRDNNEANYIFVRPLWTNFTFLDHIFTFSIIFFILFLQNL